MIEDKDRILMSDSIRGMVPELEEEQMRTFEDAFVIASFELRREESVDILSGKVVGVSCEERATKIDVRLHNHEAYGLFKSAMQGALVCDNLYLWLGTDETKLSGPFKMTSPKMLDFDHQHKMCTLGVDLIKI